MDHEKIKSELDRISLPMYVKFIAENNTRTCSECQRFDGKIYDRDDSQRPTLPLHPNCRCKYEDVPITEKSIILQNEKQSIAADIVIKHSVSAELADTLAKQIIIAKMENTTLESGKTFLLFNGRYLFSSDGRLLLNAVSGKPVSEVFSRWSQINIIGAEQTATRTFNYSYERQGIKKTGGIPEGLYFILRSETRSIMTSPISHFFGRRGWGSYSWSLHPCKKTNTRERSGFFVHGGAESTSAGCIDLREHDMTFNSFLHHYPENKWYVYVNYPEENVTVSEKNMVLPALNPQTY